MTTGEARRIAYDANRACDFAKAAKYYKIAIDNYPESVRHHASSKADIKNLTESMNCCLYMVESLERERLEFAKE